MESIARRSLVVGMYDIYIEHGTGVMEDPYIEGDILRTIECSEFDAFIISEAMNIEKYGIISKRSSWESPMFRYRKHRK